MSNVSYSAVVLDKQSRNKLIEYFKSIIPLEYEIIADHMTLNMGPIDPQFQDDLGKEVELTVTDFAKDDKVIAVGVKGYPTKDSKPHITLAVNREAGGKPYMSNKLTNWQPIQFGVKLKGKVTEILYI
jgi:hypothetical protein